MSLNRCREETDSSQLPRWMQYLDQDINEFHREDYYFAQLAQIVSSLFAKKPTKLQQFVLRFNTNSERKKESKRSLFRSKAFWGGKLGVKVMMSRGKRDGT